MTGIGRRRLLQTLCVGAATPAVTLPTGANQTAEGPTVYVGSNKQLYAIDSFSGEAVWTADSLSGFVWSSPTVVDGTVFVGTDSGKLLAFDATNGTQKWTFTDPTARVSSSPTVADGTVYVGSLEETLYAVSADTGDQDWSYAGPSDGTWSSPAVDGDTVYIGAEDNALHAVNARTGEREWVFTGPSGPVRSSPTVAAISTLDTFGDKTVFVGSMAGGLYAVDAETGDLLWSFTKPAESIFTSPAVIGKDRSATVFIGSTDTALYAVDATTGEQKWKNTDPAHRVPSSPTVARLENTDKTQQTILYFGTSTFPEEDPDGNVYAVDATSGKTLWTASEPAAGVESSPTIANVGGGSLFVGSDDGSLYAIDPTNGEIKWEFTATSGRIRSSPTVVMDPQVGDSAGSRAQLRVLGHHTHSPEIPLAVTNVGPAIPDTDTTNGGNINIPTVIPISVAGGVITLLSAHVIRQALDNKELSLNHTGKTDSGTDRKDSKTANQASNHTVGRDSPPSLTGTAEHGKRLQPSQSGEIPREPPAIVSNTTTSSFQYEDLDKDEQLRDDVNNVYRAKAPDGTTVTVLEPIANGTVHTETVESFIAGFETWSKLDDHDHIVGVVDYGSEPLPWLAMEYMDAGHLGNRVGTMTVDQALWVAITITKAIRYGHRHGVRHHCIRPSVIRFVSIEGAWDIPKVSDWGQPTDEFIQQISGANTRYLAPEQFTDSGRPVTNRTDIYQLGVVFYEMFTGQNPIESDEQQSPANHLDSLPTPPSKIVNLPKAFDEVLLTALAPDADDRYETVVHFRDALQELADSRGWD